MEPLHEDYITAGIRNHTAQEQQEFNLFATLKPSLNREGNQWAVLYGDAKDGIAGFGDSPYLAIMDFNKEFYRSVSSETKEILPGTNEALRKLTINT